MPTELFANNAVTALTLSVTASQTTFPVASNDGFPTIVTPGDFFYVVLGTEIARVDNNSSNLWTVTRGVQGSTASEHFAQAPVYCVLTKQSVEDIIAGGGGGGGSTVSSHTFATLPAPGTAGNLYLLEDSFYPFAFDNGTTLDFFLNGRKISRPNPAADWTVATSGNATLTDSKGALYLGTSSNNIGSMEMALRAVPTPPYTMTFKILPQFLGGSGGEFPQYGILFSNANTTALTGAHVFRLFTASSSSQFIALQSATFTNHGFGGQANTVQYTQSVLWGYDWWIQMFDDNTNRGFRISRDGENFMLFQSIGRTTVFTPTHYGFMGTLFGVSSRPWGLTIPTIIQG